MSKIVLLRYFLWLAILLGLVFYLQLISRSYFEREMISIAGVDQTHKLPSISICLNRNVYNYSLETELKNPNLGKHFLAESNLYIRSENDYDFERKPLIDEINMTMTSFIKNDKQCWMITTAIAETESTAILEFLDIVTKYRGKDSYTGQSK